MKRALITTTINVPRNLEAWRAAGMSDDDVVVVAGDRKTPHTEVRAFLASLPGRNVYLAPEDQEEWKSSEVVGWNTIQRRNFALLEALRHRPDYIVTVDDDNYPERPTFFETLDFAFSPHYDNTESYDALAGVEDQTRLIATDTRWWNAGAMLDPMVVARGFPLDQRNDRFPRVSSSPRDFGNRVGVVASLWLGDPDIDAVERIAVDPVVRTMNVSWNAELAPGTWCPFNTQATAFLAELAPLMMVWPGVGRYDDIWASYLAQRVMQELRYTVRFGHPLVRQTRNPHDLLRDLEAEMFGMRHTPVLAAYLRTLTLRSTGHAALSMSHRVVNMATECCEQLAVLDWLPGQTRDMFDVWLTDVREAWSNCD